MKRIIVPTDFSKHSSFAENAAIHIGSKTGSKVAFLHCLTTGIEWSKLSKERKDIYPEIKAKIAKTENALDDLALKGNEAGVSSEAKVIFLDNSKSVAQAVIEQPNDLTIVGSAGISGYKKYIAGSNTSKLLRLASSPVLVVQKPLPKSFKFKTIVFASGLEPDTHAAFDWLLKFGEAMGAENLHLVEITTPQNFRPSGQVRSEMETFVEKHHFKTIWLHNYNHFTVEAGIIEFADRVHADLIAIANHGRTDISTFFIESIPENLVKFADFPVMSIKA